MWTPIPTEYLSLEALTPGLKNTLWALCSFSYGKRMGCHPSQMALAQRARCSPRTVCTHIRRLVALSLITVIRQDHRNYYLLHHKARGKTLTESIRQGVASLSPSVHEYKTMKQFLAEERAKPRFTKRELRAVKADIKDLGQKLNKWSGFEGLRQSQLDGVALRGWVKWP